MFARVDEADAFELLAIVAVAQLEDQLALDEPKRFLEILAAKLPLQRQECVQLVAGA